ncbi:MAG: TIGR03620 family F420-dependent LLM class oxidoreductase [Alphaproteobacteria bacterium]
MKPGLHGVWSSTNTLSRDDLARLAQAVERLGYDVFWYPESTAYESLSLAGFMLGRTERLALGSGIANIYARDANTAMAGHNTLNALYGDRFILGLGVSHVPLVEGVRGHVYGPPVTAMLGYLQRMMSAKVDVAAPARNIVLAALGPKMLALARDMVQGALPYCVTPEHTAQASAILGPDRWLCVEQKICFTSDAAVARGVAAGNLKRYLAMTNYRNNWLRLGFTEAELSGSGSERFLDAMVLWGTETQIRDRLDAHRKAGATHVCIQPLDPGGGAMADMRALEAFAPR